MGLFGPWRAAHHRSRSDALLRSRPVCGAAAALRRLGADEAWRHDVHARPSKKTQNQEKWAVMGLEVLWAVCGF